MATFEIELLAEPVHKGRPKDEEPHVKRVPIKKENDSGIEYIVRFDLVSQIEKLDILENKELMDFQEELGILEDEIEELQTLFGVKKSN